MRRSRPLDFAPRRRSTASPLAFAYVLLIVYASLYPFAALQWPPGVAGMGLLHLPWPRYTGTLDIQLNLIGYMPLGLLLYAASVRSGWRASRSLIWAVVLPALLSYTMECLQYFVPGRVPSALDCLLNSVGAALGALGGMLLHHLGGLNGWHDWRERCFVPHSAGALALLALWPLGLLFPPPAPLGMGQLLPRLQFGLAQLLEGTPWDLQREGAFLAAPLPLAPGLESLVTALGLLSPCLLMLSVARPGERRLVLVLATCLLGVLATGISTALNFGPQHIWAWLTPSSGAGLLLGLVLAVAMCLFSRRVSAAWGVLATTVLIALVSGAPTDPYLAQSLAGWEQSRYIHFYGLAQWLGWLWPFGVLALLLTQLGKRES
jgi:VanZ family protein